MDPMLVYRSKNAAARRGRGRSRTMRVWMHTVKEGDVLCAPGGLLRVVRKVSRYDDNGDLRCLCFAIKRQSWTDRPFTWVGRCDLMRGWRPTGVSVSLAGPLDSILMDDILMSPFRSRLRAFEARAMP